MNVSQGNLKIKEILTLRELFDVHKEWVNLQNLSELEHPFLDWNWITCWWDRMIFEKKKPIVITVSDNSNCICGIAPFQINKKGIIKTLEGYAQEFCDYIDWLCLPGMENEVGKVVYGWIKETKKKCDLIRIYNIPLNSVAYRILNKFGKQFISKHSIAPYILIEGSYADYLHSLKPKFVNDTKRRQRKLENEKGAVRYFVLEDRNKVQNYVEIIAKWHHARLGEKKESSYLDREKMQEHVIMLYSQMFDSNMLHLSGLEINKQIAALNVAFKYKHSLFSYTPVFDPEFYQYSIIRLLKLKNIEECYNQKLKKYDFCLGGESYKFNFNPQINELFSFTMYSPTLKGLLKKIYDYKIKAIIRKFVS
jgi:CelD/BcsL family acetyltransferase involved in cellulose biosynthesis